MHKEEKIMARNFTDVVKAIKEIAPQELVDALDKSMCFWAPEAIWHKLSEYVNRYVVADSTDETSVAVYAILCDCSKDEMRARFKADNL